MLPVYMYGVEETLREQFLDAMERDMSRRESKAAAMRLEYATSDLKRMMRLIDKLETISCVVIQLRGRTAQDVGEAAGLLSAVVNNNRDHYVVLVVPTATLLVDMLPYMLNISGIWAPPFDTEHLDKMIERITDDYYLLVMDDDGEKSPFVALKYLGSIVRLRPGEIDYVEAQDKKLRVHRPEERNELAVYDRMDNMKKKLGNRFFHCHRSYLVNIDAIRRIDLPGMEIELMNGKRVPISRSCREQAKQLILDMEEV